MATLPDTANWIPPTDPPTSAFKQVGVRLRHARSKLAANIRHNLRARVAIGIGLPLLLALVALSFVQYWRERHLLEEQAQTTALQFGQLVTGSLRQAMLLNDPDLARDILVGINDRQTIERAEIVNMEGTVLVQSRPRQPGELQHAAEPGCTTCHRLAADRQPSAAVVARDAGLVRVAVPINNEPACAGCHPDGGVHLGILLMDVPVRILWPHAIDNLKVDLAISAAIALLITASVYWLVHRLVVRRVEAFRQPLAALSAGNFQARLPSGGASDEIGDLAQAFNGMAVRLDRHVREEQSLAEMRQRAIVEERERIARELHDGLAQVLGYVHTKATAVRLLLGRQQTEAATAQLGQLEEAARGLFIDVREAILGLRMTSRGDLRLTELLREYAQHFEQFSDVHVALTISPAAEMLALPADCELQLLRIVQEALTNIRKHAQAASAQLTVRCCDHHLELDVVDDGHGFEPVQSRPLGRPHFGLSTMRERAEAIGAELTIQSQPGHGTRVAVRLPVTES